MKTLSTLSFALAWIFGFFSLLAFDLFVEAFVFEWLAWNGTNKNDWFFALWWGAVAVWFLYGSVTIMQRVRRVTDQENP